MSPQAPCDLKKLAEYKWGPTELHERVMALRMAGFEARILYQTEEYPYYRTVWFHIVDHEFTLGLPRKKLVAEHWVSAGPVKVTHIQKTLFSDDLVQGVARKLMEIP